MRYKKSLFIFRRDLRLEDNTGLIFALKDSESVIPAFIFDRRQVDKNKNPYFSENAFRFMVESLEELDEKLKYLGGKLYIFEGIAENIVEELILKEKISALYINKDYTPFSRKRDDAIRKICEKNGVTFHECPDTLLNEPENALKSDGKPYTIFTPFWKNASKIPVKLPEKNNHKNYYNKNIPNISIVKSLDKFLSTSINTSISASLSKSSSPLSKSTSAPISKSKYISNATKITNIKTYNAHIIHGGRSKALIILKRLSKLKNYDAIRNYPALEGTSRLSAHLKFGTISVREAYAAIWGSLTLLHPLLRQLYWRDFFYHIAYHFPKIFGTAFQEKYSGVRWDNNADRFKAWCNGMTGYPIVDAGMRELNNTGYMHNRVRMIVASFLTKDLHIDWRLGEKYFAQKLVDYDPCLNNGNWQWAASTGCDAQPYFRIFNPWLQQKKFDPKCEYIKKWISELRNLSSEEIHSIEKKPAEGYPKQIVDHYKESKEAIGRYKSL